MTLLARRLRETNGALAVASSGSKLCYSGSGWGIPTDGCAAGFPFLVHSHMLRHSTGSKLANDGHDTRAIQAYLGHRSIASTVRYWKD